jgi:hypothetical protein
MSRDQRSEPLGEGLLITRAVEATEPLDDQKQAHRLAAPRKIERAPGVAAVDPITPGAARRTRGASGGAFGVEHNGLIGQTDAVDEDVRIVRHGHLSLQRSGVPSWCQLVNTSLPSLRTTAAILHSQKLMLRLKSMSDGHNNCGRANARGE